MQTRTSRDLRRENLRKLLRIIYFNESVTRLELSQLSGFSPATITNLATQMLEQGLIESAGVEQPQGGRPREMLRLRRDYGYFIGVEVAETHIHSELFDVKLNSLARIHSEIAADVDNPETIADHVASGVRELITSTGIDKQCILAAGVGLPGVVHPVEGVSVFAPNWGWKNVPLRAMLSERLEIPFQIDNGFRMLSLAEALFGAGKGVSDLVVVLLGTGVAAGIITRHQLWRGASNSAGEWGHTSLDANGPPCRCGRRGCVEAYTGAPAIIRVLQEVEPKSPLLEFKSQTAIVTALCVEAMKGVPTACAVLDSVIHYLGLGVANLVNLINPARVVLGGWCGNALAPYVLPRLRETVNCDALAEAASVVDFKASELDTSGVSLGAACVVLETFLAGELLSLFDSRGSA